jgi:ribosomal protein L22
LGSTKWKWRIRPAPMGRAFRERRRQNHITIRVADGEDEEE